MSKFMGWTLAILLGILVGIPLLVLIGLPVELIVIIIALVGAAAKWYAWRKPEKDMRDHMEYEIPHQLEKLVKQAHMGRGFDTEPEIYVSPEMHEKLVYPLTREIVELISATEYPVAEAEFKYELVHSEWKNAELHGTVKVDIDYRDTSKQAEAHCHDVLIYLVCKPLSIDSYQLIYVDHN